MFNYSAWIGNGHKKVNVGEAAGARGYKDEEDC